MKLAYVAYDSSGASKSGTTEAASVAEARESLRRQGLFVSEIAPLDAGAPAAPLVARSRTGKGQRLKNLAMFARQLHVLIGSGTPIVQALNAIERQCDHAGWRAIVGDLRHRVEEGAPLSEAMRQHPHDFDAVTRSLMAAGESSGNLPQMLDRLASLSRKQLHLRSTILGALVYPALLVGIGFIVLIVMLMFVLPRFSGLFENLDSPLPPTTQLLLWISDLLWAWWYAILPLLIALGFCARWWLNSAAGRARLHALILDLPRCGRLARSMMTAQLARMLGTLLESRVALMDALQLTRDGTRHVRYAELLTRAEAAVGRGEPVSAVLASSDLIAACVQEAIRNGEQSGNIGQPLLQMADFLDEQNDVVVKSLTSLLEPLILIVLGLIVGFIALSMFLPLFDLVSSAQGGG